MSDDQQVRERHFVEEMGLLFSEMGGQRMMGRVLGWLLICDPSEQSSAQLADALDASAGSISTATRQLVASGMIEKVAIPGERATFFRVRTGMWVDMVRRRSTMLRIMRETAERGLDLLAHEPDARRRRLREFRDFYAFMEGRMPSLLDAWLAQAEEET